MSRGKATSGEPICNGMIRLANANTIGVAKSSSMIVPCMVNSWLYCSVDRNCMPGRASSARISIAITAADEEERERGDQVQHADHLVIGGLEQPEQGRTLDNGAHRTRPRNDRLRRYGRHRFPPGYPRLTVHGTDPVHPSHRGPRVMLAAAARDATTASSRGTVKRPSAVVDVYDHAKVGYYLQLCCDYPLR